MHLGNVLLRIALTSDTTSSTALLQSLLALSSLHRHDVHLQAAELKIAALKSLGAVMGSDIGTKEAIQHVAAGMLLCSFEVKTPIFVPPPPGPRPQEIHDMLTWPIRFIRHPALRVNGHGTFAVSRK